MGDFAALSVVGSRKPIHFVRNTVDSLARSLPAGYHDLARMSFAKFLPSNRTIYAEQFAHIALRTVMRSSPGIFIDAGANRGNYLGTAFDAGCTKAYAVEPVGQSAAMLCKRYAENEVEVFQAAVSDHNGTETFYENLDNPELSSLTDRSDIDSKRVREVEVELITLDTLIPEAQHGQISYIKVDVEGNELEVISGAQSILNASISFIQFEAQLCDLQEDSDNRNNMIFEIFTQNNYGILPVVEWCRGKAPRCMSRKEFLSACDLHLYTDYLAFPKW